MDRNVLERKALTELREIASTMELRGFQRLKKAELIDLIMGDPTSRNGSPTTNGGRDAGDSAGDEGDAAAVPVAPEAHGSNGEVTDAPSAGEVVRRAEAIRDGAQTDAFVDRSAERADHERSRERTRETTYERGGAAGGPGRRNKRERRRGKGREGEPQQQQQHHQQQRGGPAPYQEDLSEMEVREGVLDLLPEGYGFMRCSGYLAGPKDVYVSQSYVRRYNLRRGDLMAGPVRFSKGNEKFPALARVDTVEGEPAVDNPRRVDFKDLTPYFPRERLKLETAENAPVAMRIVDLIAPIGKGQRGLIVSPPKAGKTTILKQIAQAVERNNPEVYLMVLLVDERPEEVTDFERSTSGQVISSTFDRPAEDHTQVAELCIERAKRLVERGRDVVVLLDSITRLARAYNLAAPASGRILSGGVDSAALYPPKRFFGAARNVEEGGSLTILATALVETGSKMDEVIFEEFKGTGNMELRLDRKLEQKRIFPAVDIEASGTRKEELLLAPDELEVVWRLRRVLFSLEGGASLELLIDKLKVTKTNHQFLQAIQKSSLQ